MEKYMWRREMNNKMQERRHVYDKRRKICRIWEKILVFMLISVALLFPIRTQAAESLHSGENQTEASKSTQEQVTVDIPVKVKITGSSQRNEIFSFLLKQNDEQSPMPKTSKVQVTGTKKDAFQISYTRTGVYRYTLSQMPGENKNWSYDQSVYSLEIYILRNDQTDDLQSLILAYNANGEKVDPIFTNGYQAPVVRQRSMTVKTGDTADVETLLVMMLICGGVMVGTYGYKKKIAEKK